MVTVDRMSSFGANWDCPKTGDSDWYPMISTTHLFPVLLLLQVDLLLLITGRRYRRTLADHSLPLGRGGAFRDSRVRWVILVQVVVAFEPKGVLTLCFSFVVGFGAPLGPFRFPSVCPLAVSGFLGVPLRGLGSMPIYTHICSVNS